MHRLIVTTLLLSSACLPERIGSEVGCGNGIVEGAEACDDGNAEEADHCLSTCVFARCGDGIHQTIQDDPTMEVIEECDDGNADDTDACVGNCRMARCGDGLVQNGVEGCDDANSDNDDACVTGCVAARCGDGFVQTGVEACDDGNTIHDDACDTNCLVTGSDTYDDDGDCFCEQAPCAGSAETTCEVLQDGDCNDGDAGIAPGLADSPDLAQTDANCDGLDGDLNDVIFVKEGGNDRAPGTSVEAAVGSFQAAMEIAANSERNWVLVSGDHRVVPIDPWLVGPSVAGGYNTDFTTRSGRSSIALPNTGLVLQGSADAVWQSLALTADTGAPHSIALTLEGTQGLVLEDCFLRSRAATHGLAGGDGASGGAGQPGGTGGSGGPAMASRGSAGTSICGGDGGRGGTGSLTPNPPASARGEDAALLRGRDQAEGGAAGNGYESSGSAGQTSTPGSTGPKGADGSINPVWQNRTVVLQHGAPGNSGTKGGGGGGGGGGGPWLVGNRFWSGGGGGGGGSGGCPGLGGDGGTAAGSSIALVLDQAAVTLSGGRFIASAGGTGGGGGDGGSGGNGGSAGQAGSPRGGNGGAGGRGGSGGQGGSGAAGASISVLCTGASVLTNDGATLQKSNATAGVNGAPNGVSAQTFGCD